MCSIDLLQRLGAHRLPSAVTVTSSALACCLRKRWTLCLDPALAQANLRPREQRSRVLLPPCHVSSGCFQASPLYSPYPVLCLCGCSMAATSFAVPRLQVAFWGNPSHKAGVRGVVLVSIHSRLERQPARQVCFLHHRLTPGLCSGTNRSHKSTWIPVSPTNPAGVGNGVPAVSICPYLCCSKAYAPLQPSTANTGCTLWQSPLGTSIPAMAMRKERVLFPSLAFPAAQGKWQHMALPRCQPRCQTFVLCSSWTVTQPGI